jgi:hypothetical protein
VTRNYEASSKQLERNLSPDEIDYAVSLLFSLARSLARWTRRLPTMRRGGFARTKLPFGEQTSVANPNGMAHSVSNRE